MDRLPNEVLEIIFCHLDKDSLFYCHNVSKKWRQIIIQRYWSSQLLSYSQNDFYLKQNFLDSGWHHGIQNDDLIRKLYLKLTRHLKWRWLNAQPIVEDYLMQTCTPENFHTDKITAFVVYKDKLFVRLANGSIERRFRTAIPSAHTPTVPVKQVLHSQTVSNPPLDGQNVDENHVLGSCPLVLAGHHNNILVSVESRKHQTLMLWDAETEQFICQLSTPEELGSQRRVYDLAASTTHIVCLASWSLILWKLPSRFSIEQCLKPMVVHDFEPVQEFQNWLECHTVEMNHVYLVTLATRIRFPSNNVGGNRSESFINVRKFSPGNDSKENDQIVFDTDVRHPFPTRGKNRCVDIDRIKLSPTRHLLAVLQVERSPRTKGDNNDLEDGSEDDEEHSSDSFSSHFRGYVYAVRIYDLSKGGQLIYSLPMSSSIFSMVRVPVQWVGPSPGGCAEHLCGDSLGGGEKLFFKYVPKPDCVEEVQLGVWDSKTQKTSTLEAVKLFTSSDLLCVTYSQIAHLYNKFPSAQQYEAHVGDLNLEDDSDINDPWQNEHVYFDDNTLSEIAGPREVNVPEFQVRGAFYDYWS